MNDLEQQVQNDYNDIVKAGARAFEGYHNDDTVKNKLICYLAYKAVEEFSDKAIMLTEIVDANATDEQKAAAWIHLMAHHLVGCGLGLAVYYEIR